MMKRSLPAFLVSLAIMTLLAACGGGGGGGSSAPPTAAAPPPANPPADPPPDPAPDPDPDPDPSGGLDPTTLNVSLPLTIYLYGASTSSDFNPFLNDFINSSTEYLYRLDYTTGTVEQEFASANPGSTERNFWMWTQQGRLFTSTSRFEREFTLSELTPATFDLISQVNISDRYERSCAAVVGNDLYYESERVFSFDRYVGGDLKVVRNFSNTGTADGTTLINNANDQESCFANLQTVNGALYDVYVPSYFRGRLSSARSTEIEIWRRDLATGGLSELVGTIDDNETVRGLISRVSVTEYGVFYSPTQIDDDFEIRYTDLDPTTTDDVPYRVLFRASDGADIHPDYAGWSVTRVSNLTMNGAVGAMSVRAARSEDRNGANFIEEQYFLVVIDFLTGAVDVIETGFDAIDVLVHDGS
ncbi:MAG: hypothetical protein AAGF46_03450 [Pseudomonadota bacterium]